MADQMWRFPDNNYTSENGLDTSDMEMFKKDPVSSLAREILDAEICLLIKFRNILTREAKNVKVCASSRGPKQMVFSPILSCTWKT